MQTYLRHFANLHMELWAELSAAPDRRGHVDLSHWPVHGPSLPQNQIVTEKRPSFDDRFACFDPSEARPGNLFAAKRAFVRLGGDFGCGKSIEMRSRHPSASDQVTFQVTF